jgi:hypothetical protein
MTGNCEEIQKKKGNLPGAVRNGERARPHGRMDVVAITPIGMILKAIRTVYSPF